MRLEPSKEKARYERLKMVGCGLVLVFMGVLRLRQGLDVVTHSTGQPMFSWGLIAGGVVCIILSLIPNSWVASAVDQRIARRSSNKRSQ